MTPSSARALVALAGRTFIPLSWLARLPMAMGQIAVLLLVAETTGSYGAGGLVAAALAIGSAVGGPVSGALADRHGQRLVLLVEGPTHAIGLLAVTLLATHDASRPVLLLTALAAGLFVPQVGPLVRVRWVAMIRRDAGGRPAGSHGDDARQAHRIGQAFAFEGAADESTFVAGPAVVGVLATVAGTTTAPLVAAGLSLTAATWFGVHRSARLVEPSARATLESSAVATPTARVAEPTRPRFRVPGGLYTVILLIGAFALGNVFGGTQAGVTAFTAELGRPGAAGLVYALLGTGSAVAGLASAALPARFGHSRRLLVFGAGLAVLAVPLLIVGSLAWLCVAMVLFGCAVAPFLISLYALAERTVSLDRAATVMTLLASAVVVGYATGSSTAGVLGDSGGHRSAFLVPVAAGMLALVTAAAGRARLSRLDMRAVDSAAAPGPTVIPEVDAIGG